MPWLCMSLWPYKFCFLPNIPSWATQGKKLFFPLFATELPSDNLGFKTSWNRNRASQIADVTARRLSAQTWQQPVLWITPIHGPSAAQILGVRQTHPYSTVFTCMEKKGVWYKMVDNKRTQQAWEWGQAWEILHGRWLSSQTRGHDQEKVLSGWNSHGHPGIHIRQAGEHRWVI